MRWLRASSRRGGHLDAPGLVLAGVIGPAETRAADRRHGWLGRDPAPRPPSSNLYTNIHTPCLRGHLFFLEASLMQPAVAKQENGVVAIAPSSTSKSASHSASAYVSGRISKRPESLAVAGFKTDRRSTSHDHASVSTVDCLNLDSIHT